MIGIQREALTTKLVQNFERCERRFGNPSSCNQAVTTIERLFHNALLFENVGEAPVRHFIHQPVTLTDGVGHPRAHIYGVGDLRLILVTGVEFAPDQGEAGKGRGLDLVMHLFYSPADHALARNTFVSAEHIWCAIVSIYV